MLGASILAPEPVFAGLGPQGSTGSTGLLESSGGNLLSPSTSKNKLKVAGNVVNQIERRRRADLK
jgi:hypothetical protein